MLALGVFTFKKSLQWCAALMLKNFKLQKVARTNFKDKIAGVLGPSSEKYVVCVDAF